MSETQSQLLRYLRLSITKRCEMGCIYCRPVGADNDPELNGSLLSSGEIDALVRHLVLRHGLQKVRLTGGEPTARRDLLEIVSKLSRIPGLRELALTTNGLRLASMAPGLRESGLHRVNISIDSLDPDCFAQITGAPGLERILRGIHAARAAGLTPIKINTVVIKGRNDHEIPDLVRFAADEDLAIRFIELMPMGPLAAQWHDHYVPMEAIRQILEPIVQSWHVRSQGSDSALAFDIELTDGRTATVGFISPMSCPFCSTCSRIRVASDGEFFPCLMDRPAGSLMPALRPILDADLLDSLLTRGLSNKAPEHPSAGYAMMTNIGG